MVMTIMNTAIKGLIVIFLFLVLTSQELYAKEDYYLYVKPCLDCGWFQYHEPFRIRETCEIARNGIFVEGVSKCLKKGA